VGFSERFKLLRQKQGWTQQDIADKLNMSRSTIANYESGEKKIPREETLIRIADLFNTTTDYLLGRIDEPTSTKEPDKSRIANIENQDTKITFHGRELTTEQMRQLRKYISKVLLDDEEEENGNSK
jgi:transcriptional regulator with XRE-family HTH domain